MTSVYCSAAVLQNAVRGEKLDDYFYSQVMHDLHQTSGPFLFPCTIEFSLICAAILFIMWKHVGSEHEKLKLGRLRELHYSK